jgi:hypothetical protein
MEAVMARSEDVISTAPWPGPGDSEGPVDPDPTIRWNEPSASLGALLTIERAEVVTSSWPGPGDSEGPVDAEVPEL